MDCERESSERATRREAISRHSRRGENETAEGTEAREASTDQHGDGEGQRQQRPRELAAVRVARTRLVAAAAQSEQQRERHRRLSTKSATLASVAQASTEGQSRRRKEGRMANLRQADDADEHVAPPLPAKATQSQSIRSAISAGQAKRVNKSAAAEIEWESAARQARTLLT